MYHLVLYICMYVRKSYICKYTFSVVYLNTFRCADPVDVIMCDDVSVVESLRMRRQYAMVGYIVMKDSDSAKYVMQASQNVRLILKDKVSIEAVVVSFFSNKTEYFSKLKMEHVPIVLDDINSINFKQYCTTHKKDISKPIVKIKAKFLIKHRYFQDLHQAIDNLSPVIIQKLFPSASITRKHFQEKFDYEFVKNFRAPFKSDKLQFKAIYHMLSVSAEVPFLLVGPFGTGKTHVLACTAAAIVNEDANAKVLIATHHNKSADTFISKYFGTIESTKSLPPTVAPIRLASKDLNEDLEKPYFMSFDDDIITKELLDERRIVVTTFLTALRFAFAERVPKGYFTHILIDEGAQAREPETIAPLIFADERTKVIIAGDHLQVIASYVHCYACILIKPATHLVS